MILCFDIGNTNIKYAVYDGEELKLSCRIATDINKTSDEYGEQLATILYMGGVQPKQISGGIFSSVVPQLDYTMERMCRNYLKIKPLEVAPGLKTGINLRVEDAKEVGADRVVNNVSAVKKYGTPLIVVDFGTATTFNVIDRKGDFIGGSIAPGMKGALSSLVSDTAKLPRVDIEKPDKIIATNTVTNIQSGIFYGFVGLVDYTVKKMKEEMGCAEKVKVIATGGFSDIIAKESDCIDVVDKFLTLDGLKYLYYMNQREAQ